MQAFKHLTPYLAVAPQLTEDDIRRAAEHGFSSVVNNRPDFEEPGQPLQDELRQTAEALGLDYHYLLVISGGLSLDNVQTFNTLQPALREPVLMFCRSGTRCTHLWALQQAATTTVQLEQIVATAAAAGYDLTALLPMLQDIRQKGITTSHA